MYDDFGLDIRFYSHYRKKLIKVFKYSNNIIL